MNNRELLELAAKAAGYEPEDFITSKQALVIFNPEGGPGGNIWSPLFDSGDALRLAVKLKIHISGFSGTVMTDTGDCSFCERYGDDPYAATRRAIVRAAASMAPKD